MPLCGVTQGSFLARAARPLLLAVSYVSQRYRWRNIHFPDLDRPMIALRILTLLLLGLLVGCQEKLTRRQQPLEPALIPSDVRQSASRPSLSMIRPVAYLEDAVANHTNDSEALPEPISIPVPERKLYPELTLEELTRMAMGNNPAIAEADALVEAARGQWEQVGLYPNTVLGYSGQQLFSNGVAEQQGLFVGQEFVRGGKLKLNRAIAFQDFQRAQQVLAAQIQRVSTDIRLNYYDVLVAQQRIETANELVEIAQKAVDTAEALLAAQEVSRVDVIRARTQLQTAQLVWKNANNLHQAAWSRLAAVTGLPDLPRQHLNGDIANAIDEINMDEMLFRIASESPQMAAALTDLQRARWSVDRAYAEPISNVDVQAIVQSDNGTGSSNANLQVTVPIPWFNHNQGGIRRAHAEVVAAQRAVDRLQLNFKYRLAEVFQRYETARNQVDDYSREDGILSNAQETLELVGGGYEAGELSYLDLITAQRTYSETNLAYIESLGQLWAATIEMEGLLLKGSLEFTRRPVE